MNRILLSFFIILVSIGCISKSDERKSPSSEKVYISAKANQANTIDTLEIIKMVSDDLVERLSGQHIRNSGFDKHGHFYIEYCEDSTGVDPKDIIWECYRIRKDKVITGDLNLDDQPDFAVQSIWAPTMGNMFGIEWHLYVFENNQWLPIENDFGGGKFSDMETVIAIENGKLKTKFQQLDEKTAWLKDSFEIREYELCNQMLKRK